MKPLIFGDYIKIIVFHFTIFKNVFVSFIESLKVVSATFLLFCFVCLKERTLETKKNVFYFTLKALLVLEIIKF